MNWFCILICAVTWSGAVWAKSESTTLSSITSTPSNSKSSAKVKRQHRFPYERPPNFSHYVGDAAALDSIRRNADANAQIINQVDQKDSNGNYNYAYETTNGIKVRQTSYMRGNNRVIVGYYSYIGPDSKIYTTHYTADEYGYRAKSSHLPVQDVAVQPLPFVSSTPFSDPGPFATPAPFIVSSTSPPFVSSAAPFRASSPYSDGPSSTPYRAAYQPYNIGYSSTASPIVSSSTPFASTISPQFSEPKRPRFPIYGQPTAPFRGYSYTNPRINSHYSVVAQQTPAPVFFSSSTKQPLRRFPIAAVASNESPRVTPQFGNGFNEISSTPLPFQDDIPRFKEYIPPAPIVSSTPRPFNNIQPDTVLITPKPAYNPPQLPNSLSINQNLLPPYLSVGPLTSPPRPQNIFRNNDNFIRSPQFEFNESVQSSVAPLTVTDLNFRKKRNFDVKLNEKIVA